MLRRSGGVEMCFAGREQPAADLDGSCVRRLETGQHPQRGRLPQPLGPSRVRN
jgi:hypothetical protein